MKSKRVLIRYKWCKTAALFYLLFFMFSIIATLNPQFYPLWIFFMLDFLLVVSAAFYLEITEKEVSA